MSTSLLLPEDAVVLSGDIFDGFVATSVDTVSRGLRMPWRAASGSVVTSRSKAAYSGPVFEIRTTHVGKDYLFVSDGEADADEAPGFCARLLLGQRVLLFSGGASSKKKSLLAVPPSDLVHGDVIFALPSMASPFQDRLVHADNDGLKISGYAVKVASVGCVEKHEMNCIALGVDGGSPVVVDGLAVQWRD